MGKPAKRCAPTSGGLTIVLASAIDCGCHNTKFQAVRLEALCLACEPNDKRMSQIPTFKLIWSDDGGTMFLAVSLSFLGATKPDMRLRVSITVRETCRHLAITHKMGG